MESLQSQTYSSVLGELRKRLAEPAPGRIQLLTGPRQVGKTTLLLEIAREWGERAVYASADGPESALPGWWDLLWQRVERVSSQQKALLLLDEIQYVSDWARLLKSKMDLVYRENIPLHVAVTGSSALGLGTGSRETMAGRFERLALLHWPARELAETFKLRPDEAVLRLVRQGSYPGAVGLWDDFLRWQSYVRDSIVEPAIGRDILVLEPIRKPSLLRQVFAVSVGHPSEIISLQKLCGQLGEKGSLETVAHYLQVLEQAFLVAAVPKFSTQELRRRASPPKLIPLNQAFLAVVSPNNPPTPESDPVRWGKWVENACLAHAWNSGQQVSYWREEPYEVDGVLTGTWGRWAVEVKTGAYSLRELAGLSEFCRRNDAFRPLVLCDPGNESIALRGGFDCLSWKDFLLDGPKNVPGG